MAWLRIAGFGLAAFGVALAVLAGLLGSELRHVAWADPLWALAGVLPFLSLGVRARWSPRPATMRYSRASSLSRVGGGLVARLADLPDGLRLGSVLLLVTALMRPQSSHSTDRLEHEGIDIAVALDLSESMQSQDLVPNRLEAAKVVIDDFIRRRPNDRIGLVAFGNTASTVSPLTMDHGVLRALVKRMRLGVLDGSQTAIGAGLGLALNRLDESQSETKVVVLLTDGVHNAGGIDPDTVAQEAADRGVRIYTVLLGRHRPGRSGGAVDPAQLERLASLTEGYAYVATDVQALTGTFQDLLNKLQKSVIEGSQVRAELFPWLLWAALALLMLDIVLRTTRLRRFP
ncbi:MAG: VWA domain-containing protein [Myxococcales bacterium FL481]|nr:MAG: VWA domain-containing protein [Myxococcales bacterium FL481]